MKFDPGQVVATPGALAALRVATTLPLLLLGRHLGGEWGDLEPDDKQANEDALKNGARLLSAYVLRTGVKVWVITEAVNDDGVRESTCLMLPEEY